MKLDILAFAAHPDDVELGASGTMCRHKALGKRTGVIDLTRGELGTRGSADDRDREAKEASLIMKLDARENLGLDDGFFEVNRENEMMVIEKIRKYRPEVILANAVHDRHIDHGRAATLVANACFLSGLRKIVTMENGVKQEAWRPRLVLHYVQDYHLQANFIVDISDYYESKIAAIKAFKTQFFDPDSKEPLTAISNEDYLPFIESRAREYGRLIGVRYGEGFTVARPPGISDITKLI
jgi:bacillithiol biosynthesis deacetylase BshB1